MGRALGFFERRRTKRGFRLPKAGTGRDEGSRWYGLAPFDVTPSLALLQHAAFLVLLLAASFGLGRAAARPLALRGPFETAAVSCALGLALLSHAAFALGLLGLLSRGPLLVLGGAGLVASVWAVRSVEVPSLLRRARGGRAAVGAGLAAVAIAPLLALALQPPHAFDETLYHLPYARAFVESGALPFLPELRFPVFAQLVDVLFAAAFAFAGDVAPHLAMLLATLATAGLVAAWAKSAVPREAAVLGAALFLGTPLVVHLGTTGFVEAGLALFATASLFSVARARAAWANGDSARAPFRWLLLAGLFAGSAAATKYLGLAVCAGAAALAADAAPRGLRFRAAAVASLGALLAAAPTYARNVLLTKNPLFPYLAGLFGRHDWEAMPWSRSEGPIEALAALVRLPWDGVFARDAWNRQPPLSPAFLAGLLVLAAVAAARVLRVRSGRARREGQHGVANVERLARSVRAELAFVGAYVATAAFLPRDTRYLAPILPVAGLLLAAALVRAAGSLRLTESGRLRALGFAGALALAPGWLYAGYRMAREGAPPLTPEARERFLAARLRGYAALARLNETHGADYAVYAFRAEELRWFARGRFSGDWVGPACYARVLGPEPAGPCVEQFDPTAVSPERLRARLAALGVTHLLLAGPGLALSRRDRAAFEASFRRVDADGGVEVWSLRDLD